MTDIANKIYNIELVIEDVKKEPQTYSTILKENNFNCSLNIILRRKLNKLFKHGTLLKTSIPGTRFGQVIIYIEPRPYRILVENSRIGVNVYYFYEFERVSKFYIKVKNYWKLDYNKWVEYKEPLEFFDGHILKFI